MAGLKWFKWLFIPFLAILLMSHNTFASDLDIPVRLYSTSGYVRATYTSGTTITNVGFNAFNNELIANQIHLYYASMTVFDGLYLDVPVYVYNYNEDNSVDGYMNVGEVSCNNGAISCQLAGFNFSGSGSGQVYHAIIYVSGSGSLTDIQLYPSSGYMYALRLYNSERAQPLPLTAYRLMDNSTDMSTVNTYIQALSSKLDNIYQRLGVMNGNIPSADDIAEAINAPEEHAADNISNQSSDDYQMQSANMSSLFSQFGDFITAVNGATIGDCTIPADFNHIDLGILDLCKNPVPDYVQVAVSIVSCMIVAPYLMNIIKRILAIADKVREV